MDPIKIGDGIELHELKLSSADEIFREIEENREHLRRWLPFIDHTLRTEDTLRFIRAVNGSVRDLVLEIRNGGSLAGLLAVKEIDPVNSKAEIGYWISRKWEGKGIVTRSCAALINHCFNSLNLNRVQIKAATGNSASIMIPERLGFKFEGIERSGEYLNGDYVDLVVYSMLKSEWDGLTRS